MPELLGPDDIDPDGVRIIIDWEKFVPDASVFVPCLNVKECVQQIGNVCRRKNYDFQHRVLVENQLLGVRFWRTA